MQHRVSSSRRVDIAVRNVIIFALVGLLLYFGAFWQIFDPRPGVNAPSDVDKYQCYAVAFWQGKSGVSTLPAAQCQFLSGAVDVRPLRTLPKEYPFLVLVPLSLPLLLPAFLYKVGFALLMFLMLIGVFAMLNYLCSPGAAFAFLLYVVLGCLGTAEGRFDLLPSMLTLVALLLAERRRWNVAFGLLAVAALLKLYPLILLLPFIIAQQKEIVGRWLDWRRVQALGVFVVVCVVVSAISLLLSVSETLGPLSYFEFRPLQIESVSASIIWLLGTLGHMPLSYVYSYGSVNIISSLSSRVSLVMSFVLVCGLLYVAWLQVRGKISLAMATLLTLLVVLTTGKVFSAQYLLWVAPLLAYVGRGDWRWLLGWGIVSAVTTVIYPFTYEHSHLLFLAAISAPPLYPTIFIRNVVLLAFTLTLLSWCGRQLRQQERQDNVLVLDYPAVHDEEKAERSL